MNQTLKKVHDSDADDDLPLSHPAGHAFSNWCDEAQKALLSCDAPALPIQTFSSHGCRMDRSGKNTLVKNILVDTRTLVDHHEAVAAVAQANHMELLHQRHTLNDIQQAFNVESRIASEFTIGELFSAEKSLKRSEENLLHHVSPPTLPPSSHGVLMFSVSLRSLSASASLSEITTAFFVDDFCTGHDIESKSPAWTDLDTRTKEKLRRKCSLIKRSVRPVLMHADSFPPASDNRVQHKRKMSYP